jgi:hypothetical protein
MKKSIYFLTYSGLFILFTIFGSCHKNNGSSSYISFLENGSPKGYSTSAGCILNADSSLHNYTADFIAYNADITSEFVITLISSSPLTTSSPYLDTVNLSGPPVTINLYPSGLLGNPIEWSSFFLFPNHVTLQLKAITSTFVEGTFSGDIAISSTGPVYKITDGYFHLSVK